jgi:hypothetical protein
MNEIENADWRIPVEGADDADSDRWLGEDEEAYGYQIQLEPTGKWFVCDPRSYEHEPEDHVWYCIHNKTMSWNTVLRTVKWLERSARWPRGYDMFVIEADNKTQVKMYLTAQGYNTDSTVRTSAMPSMTNTARKIELARRRIEQEQARIDFLSSLPDEPESDPDGANVIWFKKKFQPGGKEYTYAAVQTEKGTWYTTGPQTPKDFAWEDLIQWIMEDKNAQVWVAASYDPLV